MNRKIRFLIFLIITVFSAIIISVLNKGTYYGVNFDHGGVATVIFLTVFFVCICTACKTNYRSSLFSNHIVIRCRSRRRALLKDIAERIATVFALVIAHSLIIFIAKFKEVNIPSFLIYVLLNILVISFMVLLQVFLETRFNSDLGYFAVIVGFFAGIFISMEIFDYCELYNNLTAKILFFVNKFNILNYISLPVIKKLGVNVTRLIIAIAALDLTEVILNLVGLKRKDVFERR